MQERKLTKFLVLIKIKLILSGKKGFILSFIAGLCIQESF